MSPKILMNHLKIKISISLYVSRRSIKSEPCFLTKTWHFPPAGIDTTYCAVPRVSHRYHVRRTNIFMGRSLVSGHLSCCSETFAPPQTRYFPPRRFFLSSHYKLIANISSRYRVRPLLARREGRTKRKYLQHVYLRRGLR